MYLMYTYNENGDRVYTLKVRIPSLFALGSPRIIDLKTPIDLAPSRSTETHRGRQAHRVRPSGPILARRQVLSPAIDHQEALQSAADPAPGARLLECRTCLLCARRRCFVFFMYAPLACE